VGVVERAGYSASEIERLVERELAISVELRPQ
jgi:hypothetical protein